jgi:hypothetical protein
MLLAGFQRHNPCRLRRRPKPWVEQHPAAIRETTPTTGCSFKVFGYLPEDGRTDVPAAASISLFRSPIVRDIGEPGAVAHGRHVVSRE